MGVSYHKTYDVICVIDFAAEYNDHLEQHQKHNQSSFNRHQQSNAHMFGGDEFIPETMNSYSPNKHKEFMFNESPINARQKMPSGQMAYGHHSKGMSNQFGTLTRGDMGSMGLSGFESKQNPQMYMNGNFASKVMNGGGFEQFDLELEEDWPEGAIKCKEKKHSKVVGNMKVTKVVKLFLMKDGSTEVIENTLKELI
jgi:hypothetical protein